MRTRLIALVPSCLLIFSGVGRSAFAFNDLRYELAVLREGVDAGITQDEFHQLRIKIAALYRIASEDQRNAVSGFVQHLRAADAIWTGMKSHYSCRNVSSYVADPAACFHELADYYRSLGMNPPEVGSVIADYQVIGPILKQIADDADMALSKLK